MQLRFYVDQAAAFLRGVDSPNAIAEIEVDPAKLDENTRRLIAERLRDNDVCQLEHREDGDIVVKLGFDPITLNRSKPIKLKANGPTFEALMEAVNENEREVREGKSRRAARRKRLSAFP
jgi:hypothetical protein